MTDPDLVTLSISKIVRNIIEEDLAIQDGIFRGYANMSSVSRIIQPLVEKITERTVSLEAITTALKRIAPVYKEFSAGVSEVIAKSTINVRTDVAKLSVVKTRKNIEKMRRKLITTEEEVLQISEGISAFTIIFDQSLRRDLLKHFGKDILEDEPDLAAILVHSPLEVISRPGCAFAFYSQVSRRMINIQDTVSTYTDTLIVVKLEDAGKVFSALTDLLGIARRFSSSKSK
ncbi:MAG: hypothetical protein ACE1ZC_05810 [Nitrososphaerales archaeon]|nr:hypothetical protein [Nitrososphaerota archaeon]